MVQSEEKQKKVSQKETYPAEADNLLSWAWIVVQSKFKKAKIATANAVKTKLLFDFRKSLAYLHFGLGSQCRLLLAYPSTPGKEP